MKFSIIFKKISFYLIKKLIINNFFHSKNLILNECLFIEDTLDIKLSLVIKNLIFVFKYDNQFSIKEYDFIVSNWFLLFNDFYKTNFNIFIFQYLLNYDFMTFTEYDYRLDFIDKLSNLFFRYYNFLFLNSTYTNLYLTFRFNKNNFYLSLYNKSSMSRFRFIYAISAGRIGYKGKKKSSPQAFTDALSFMSQVVMKYINFFKLYHFKNFRFFLKYNSYLKSIYLKQTINIFRTKEYMLSGLIDSIKVPHSKGVRPPKKRRI